MAVGIGAVYVTILPNMVGFDAALQEGVVAAASEAGTVGGEIAGAKVAEGAAAGAETAAGSSAFAGAGALAGGIFAAYFGMKAIEAFDTIETRQKQLAYGLSKLGMDGETAAQPLVDFAKNFSLATGQSEESILKLEASLANLGRSTLKSLGPEGATGMIKSLTGALINMAAGTGKPLTMFMRSVGPSILNDPAKALPMLQKFNGLTTDQVEAVHRLIDAGQKQAATQMIINDLSERWSGAAAANATAMSRLHALFTQIEISIGRYFKPLLDAIIIALTKIPAPIYAIVIAVGVMLTAIVLAKTAWEKLGRGLEQFVGTLKQIGLAVLKQVDAMVAWIAGEEGLAVAAEETTIAIDEQTVSTEAATVAAIGFNLATFEFVAIAALIAGAAFLIIKNWSKIKPVLLGIWNAVKPAIMSVWDMIKQFTVDLIHGWETIWAKVGPIVTEIGRIIEFVLVVAFRAAVAQIRIEVAAIGVVLHVLGDVFHWLDTIFSPLFKVWGAEIQDLGRFFEATAGVIARAATTIGHAIGDVVGWLGKVTGASAAWNAWQQEQQANADAAAANMRTLALNIGLAVGASGAFTDAQLQQIAAMKSSADGAAALADLQASLDLQVKNGTLSFKEYETAINAAGLAMDAQSPAAKKAAVNYHDIADQVTNLGVVTGSTSADMKTGLDTVFRTIQSDTTKGAAALKSWVSSTEGSIKQWAQGIASSIYVVGTEFQNLTHKSHDTAQNLLKDGAKLVQEFRRRTQDLAVITKKLGADSETAVMNYLSTTGQLTQQNLDNIAGMTKKQLDQLTGQAQAFSKSQQQGVQALAGPLNQQMTDILATYAQITNTVAALNAMGVTIPVDHSQLDSAAGSVSNLASQLSRLAGVNIDVSVTKPTGKASGGPVSAGTAYVIGEKGPELFIPNMSGSIVPNHELNRTQAVADSGGRRQVKLVLDTGAEFTAYLEEVISNAGVNR